MITKAILTVVLAPVNFVLGLVPAVSWPSWLSGSTFTSFPSAIGSKLALVDNWLPIDALMVVFPFVFIAWGLHMSIKGIRLVVSLLTGGGGVT